MELIEVRAYSADGLSGEAIDSGKWQYFRRDPAMQIEIGGSCLCIHGRTSQAKRFFIGLSSRRLYPADAILMVDMCMPCSMDQQGVYGFAAHLCSRLGGHVYGTPGNWQMETVWPDHPSIAVPLTARPLGRSS